MARIVTLTLSPTIDKSTSVDKVVAEHKLICEPPKFEPGGGGINVSRALMKLGVTSATVFPAGGLPGQRLQNLLTAEGIEQHAVPTESLTRENFIVVSRATNEQFRFGMPAPELTAAEQEALLAMVKKMAEKAEYVVASGSLPHGTSPDFFARVAHIARQENARLIVDTSGEALKYAVEEGVYLLKPNQKELSVLAGIEADDNESVEAAAREVIGRGKCAIVVVSMGPHGAYTVTSDFAEHINAPSVKKRSTVGAGDSMVAGMVYGCINNYPLKEMVRMGIACGTAATMNPGTELFRKQDVERLYDWLLKRG